jgi:hypothetical protein
VQSVLSARRQTARRIRWTARARLAEHEPFLPLARLRHGHTVIGRGTELVIDGFPRSANTFAVVALQLAQRRPVRIAHHLHAPAQITAAVRRGVPVLLTIREPRGAVVSCVVREPHVKIDQALVAYTRFYSRLLPHRAACVVGEFTRITTDLGGLTDDLNRKYGTRFDAFQHTPESVSECFSLIDERARRPPWDAHLGYFLSGLETLEQMRTAAHRAGGMRGAESIPSGRVSRPAVERGRELASALEVYQSRSMSALRAHAEQTYAMFVAG